MVLIKFLLVGNFKINRTDATGYDATHYEFIEPSKQELVLAKQAKEAYGYNPEFYRVDVVGPRDAPLINEFTLTLVGMYLQPLGKPEWILDKMADFLYDEAIKHK